jgi:hypothetical protein
MKTLLLSALLGAVTAASLAAGPKGSVVGGVDFSREVRPILSDKCFACHGPDEGKRQASLRLDTKEGAFADRSGYQVIVPGDASASRLYQRISHAEAIARMPPPSFELKPSEAEVEIIRRWIDEGAEWETHWAFGTLPRSAPPAVNSKAWTRNEIDHFVLARLEREGLSPSPEADKNTLLRRVSFDLTGLPPTPEQVAAFLADGSEDAYERVVAGLLRSEHYGERMAMQWLDLARYADTQGYHIDNLREMWPWRDWVIRSFNDNKPFDQFTIEQIAGDLLPNSTVEQKIATGFGRNHMINAEGGAIAEEYQTEYVVDRLETTSTVFLGLTMGCARCHDHKYDPLTQKEFYEFFAFFNTIPERGLDGAAGNAKPVVRMPSGEQRTRLNEIAEVLDALEKKIGNEKVDAWAGEWQKTALPGIPEASKKGLSAHYEFNGDLADSSGHNGPAKVPRGEVTYDELNVGDGIQFDGETRVAFTAMPLEEEGPFSVAFWTAVQPPDREDLMSVLQKVDLERERRGFEIFIGQAEPASMQLKFNIYMRLTHRWPGDAIQVRTKRKVRGPGHHYTVSYDGSGKGAGLRLFINGDEQEMIATHDSLTGPFGHAGPLEAGNGGGFYPYRGSLDDLRIYDEVIGADEMGQLFQHEGMRTILASPISGCAESVKEFDEKKKADVDGTGENVPVASAQSAAGRRLRACLSRRDRFREYYLTHVAPGDIKDLYKRQKDLRKEKADMESSIPSVMVMEEMKRPRETFILGRGDYRNKTEKVEPGVPAFLPPLPQGAPRDRLGLARWLVDPSHPLTARVTVNRYWQMYFGGGLVATSENFGSQAEAPSHPELLDWLAGEFVDSGWDVKAMQRRIVTSATYRQSSRTTAELLSRDPLNRLLARGTRYRLAAEMVRDSALAAAGLLSGKVGGPSVYPYQPPGLWKEMSIGLWFSGQEYEVGAGEDLYRRSMYTVWRRTIPPPSLQAFDAPDREECTSRRARTNTPLQALVLMNDPTYVEAARVLAGRMINEGGSRPDQRIQYAYRRTLAREASPEESELLAGLAREQHQVFREHEGSASALLAVGEAAGSPTIENAELAAWTTVASTILNLDEAISKE